MLYEILKTSKLGASFAPDMYTALWAQKLARDGEVKTLSGAPPLSFQANGQPLLDYLISGNTVQSTTPTPQNPVMPEGTGERTENVMPAGELKTLESNGVTFSSDGNGRYHISGTATASASARFNLLQAFTTPISVSNGGQGTLSFFNTSSDNNVTFIFYNGATKVDDWRQTPIRRTTTTYKGIGNKYVDNVVITVNSGATVDVTITPEFTSDGILPSKFEPYGYKIPISSAGQTTPVYLGEVESIRRIKKVVLTGDEAWKLWNGNYYSTVIDRKGAIDTILCTHFINSSPNGISYQHQYTAGLKIASKAVPFVSDLSGLKEWFVAQYAAGTPVTVWYVLAEPETGIVNEPLRKIGDYADTLSKEQAGVEIPTTRGTNTLDVLTDVKPSEIYIKYKS